MRSSHWEYLGYMSVGVGSALTACGSIAFSYFQSHFARSPQYSSYSIPLLIFGIGVMVMGVLAFVRYRKIRREEIEKGQYLPPPPVPPPPPPPPP
ncbi:hypothetical protein MUP01_09565 [Candidatus Bathyarchaeota archaeon]|nr:hypothetical protein [Candidatus Bathyarchaeota archaeon]